MIDELSADVDDLGVVSGYVGHEGKKPDHVVGQGGLRGLAVPRDRLPAETFVRLTIGEGEVAPRKIELFSEIPWVKFGDLLKRPLRLFPPPASASACAQLVSVSRSQFSGSSAIALLNASVASFHLLAWGRRERLRKAIPRTED